MRHKPIRKIRTRLRNRRQLVIIEFDDQEFVFMAAGSIKGNTGIEVDELELLIGSTIRIDFYSSGEEMFNGDICGKDNLIVKDFYIELQKPIDLLRTQNSSQLLGFRRLKEIFYFNKFGKENVGLKTEDDRVTFMLLSRFEFQSMLDKAEQHILIGSYILPEYYRKGEILGDGREISEDNKSLKWINLRYSDRVDRMHENFENSIVYFDRKGFHADSDEGPAAFGYKGWAEMALDSSMD